MSEKLLVDYIHEIEELTRNLSPTDLCILAEGFKNITIRQNAQAFIAWAEPLATDAQGHPHEAVLKAEINEAKAY